MSSQTETPRANHGLPVGATSEYEFLLPTTSIEFLDGAQAEPGGVIRDSER